MTQYQNCKGAICKKSALGLQDRPQSINFGQVGNKIQKSTSRQLAA